MVTQKTVSPCAMLNIQKPKNTVLISNISIITFLNFVFYTRAASLLASRGLEARGRTSRGRGQDPRGRGQVFWPRGRGQASRLNITAGGMIVSSSFLIVSLLHGQRDTTKAIKTLDSSMNSKLVGYEMRYGAERTINTEGRKAREGEEKKNNKTET